MTDNEIIKALEELIKREIDGYQTALEHGSKRDENEELFIELMESVVAMFNRQKEEKESLIAGQETLQKYIAEQKAEIERLNKEVDRLSQCVLYHDGQIADAKAKAIKEFEGELWFQIYADFDIDTATYKRLTKHLDVVKKEMVGDLNG
jgi:hypothetical protein